MRKAIFLTQKVRGWKIVQHKTVWGSAPSPANRSFAASLFLYRYRENPRKIPGLEKIRESVTASLNSTIEIWSRVRARALRANVF